MVTGSITDAAAVARAVAGVDRIYHLAGFVSRKPDDGARMYEVHVEGTRLLCEAARAAKVKRMVLASTSGTVAVSDRADEKPDESSPPPLALIARWAYYASKHYQEEAARRACGDDGRAGDGEPQPAAGARGRPAVLDPRRAAVPGRRHPDLTPAGGLNFVDARDVAAVLPVAMERGRPGERYLLGGYNWTFAEFFGRLARLTKLPAPWLKAPRGKLSVYATEVQAALYRKLGRTPPLEPEAVEMAGYFWYFDSTKARDELGFQARDAADTLHDTVTYLRQHVLGRRPLVSRADAPTAAE